MKITPETSIEEIVEKHPELREVLSKYGIACVVCGEPVWGTLREMASEQGLEVEDLVEELNRIKED